MGAPTAQAATILVVDDIPANRLMLERQLVRLGHHVLLAEHGREALEILRAQPVDMVMLDIMMPVMNGFEALTTIKADPALLHLPVVIVSALDDVESVARCVSLGADDFLFKPVERLLLEARVESCLVRKRLHDREQAAYAAAEAANRAKSAFVSMVSHELKNPLTGIAGYADMMLLKTLGPLTDLQVESLRAIRNLSSLMNTLLSDLTDLSKIESGHLQLETAPLQLDFVAQSAAAAVHRLIDEKQHHLSFDFAEDLPTIMADEVRLTQILTNLLSNAAKYTPERGEIVISAQRYEGEQVLISVRDNGIGIPAGEHERIFEPFFRTFEARNSVQPGTGLGLSITNHLVQLQGGTIWFSSVPGEGTTFCFTLPMAGTSNEPANISPTPNSSLRW